MKLIQFSPSNFKENICHCVLIRKYFQAFTAVIKYSVIKKSQKTESLQMEPFTNFWHKFRRKYEFKTVLFQWLEILVMFTFMIIIIFGKMVTYASNILTSLFIVS